MYEFFLGMFVYYILSFLRTVLFGEYPGSPLGGGY